MALDVLQVSAEVPVLPVQLDIVDWYRKNPEHLTRRVALVKCVQQRLLLLQLFGDAVQKHCVVLRSGPPGDELLVVYVQNLELLVELHEQYREHQTHQNGDKAENRPVLDHRDLYSAPERFGVYFLAAAEVVHRN